MSTPNSDPSPPRRRLIGFSTKMYFSCARTIEYTTQLKTLLSALPASTQASLLRTTDIFIAPDHISLTSVIAQLRTSPVPVLTGAQDAFGGSEDEDAGAFTGEVSCAVLAEVGCRIVEVGHAERRALFGETNGHIAAKAAAAARNGLVPLVCVGERIKPHPLPSTAVADSESDPPLLSSSSSLLDVQAALPEIRAQIEAVLAAIPATADVVLAYEPVWAIGAASPASPAYVVAVVCAIRDLECVRSRPAGATRILYGGSAGPGLFEKLRDGGDGDGVDGLFLGRFAHDPERFVQTILEVATV